MKVSIIACTYNRAPLIDKLLRSLTEQEFEGEHEIIVVDNNSTDDTKTVVEKWTTTSRSELSDPLSICDSDKACPLHETLALRQPLAMWLLSSMTMPWRRKTGCSG